MQTINDRLAFLIEDHLKMKKTAFAKSLKVSQQYISKLVKTGNPSDILIDDICEKYNVNEEWLRTGKGEMLNKTPDTLIEQLKQKYSMDDFETGIVEEYLNLPADKRAVFKEFIYKLAGKAQTSGEKPVDGDDLRAAHARTDKKSTPEGQKHDWDIMTNDDEWE